MTCVTVAGPLGRRRARRTGLGMVCGAAALTAVLGVGVALPASGCGGCPRSRGAHPSADPAANDMIDEGLKHSASFLRRELGRRIRIHHIPELHFVFDPSVQEGARLSKLIDDAVESDKKQHEE